MNRLVYFQSKNALAMYRTPPGLEKVWVVTVAVRPPSDTTHSASSARASTHAVYTASSSAGLVPTISDLKQQRWINSCFCQEKYSPVWFLLLSPLEGEGEAGAAAAEVHGLPVAEIVDLAPLLEVVEVEPVVETLHPIMLNNTVS